MVLSNVQSLRNTLDKLQANVCHLHEFRDACVMVFTETWLTDMELDSSLDINGFGPPICLDRDRMVKGRTQGGGVCLYINRRWCNNITVRQYFQTLNCCLCHYVGSFSRGNCLNFSSPLFTSTPK